MRPFLCALLGIAGLLVVPPLAADEPPDSAETPLLEQLSAETARLAVRADAHTAVLSVEGRVWRGMLVGEPARFVVAVDDVTEHGAIPAEGKVTTSGGTVADARLIDGDRELGVAVYELTGSPRSGVKLAERASLVRGALAVSGGGADPVLVVLGRTGGPLEDVLAEGADGVSLLAPGGRLLGLRPAALAEGEAALSCAACHGGSTWSATSARQGAPYLTAWIAPRSERPSPAPLAVPSTSTGPAAPTPARELVHVGKAFYLSNLPSGARDLFVPATVIERALVDVGQGGRLRRPYLGVVTEEGSRAGHGSGYVVEGYGASVVHFFAAGDEPGSITPDSLAVPVARKVWTPVHGVRLTSVLPDSPAAKAGLEAKHVIVEIDGRPFGGARGFARALARRRPGEEVRFAVQGLAEPVRVVLGDRDKEAKHLASAASVGLSVQPLTPDLVAFLELPRDSKGVVVRNVEAGSAAAAAGLQRGDVLFSDGNAPVRDAGELDAVLGAAKGSVLLRGRRQGVSMEFTLTLPGPTAPRKTR